MTNYAAAFYDASTIEAAIEAVANTTTIIVVPVSGGKEFILIQGASSV